jgi:plastocyanin
MKITRRDFTIGAVAGGGALGLSTALAATAKPAAKAAAAKTVSVRIDARGARFVPASLTVNVGDTVEWTNPSSILHSVDFDPAVSKVVGNVALPAGVKPFGSGAMEEAAKFSHTFTAKGVYKYICKYHEAMGMIGSVTVA